VVQSDRALLPRIYDPDGKLIGVCGENKDLYSSVGSEERGNLVDMGWDGSERLVCVWEAGYITM